MPQATHADRYTTNFAYGVSAYSKGSIFLSQLGYVIGQDKLMETIQKYFEDFKFKHPVPNDIKRTAEKVSGMELNWYLKDWTQTTNTIDYGIKSVEADGESTKVTMERIGEMPMPLDILVVGKDGTQQTLYVPLRMMFGEKDNPYPNLKRTVLEDWPWAYPTYEFTLDMPLDNVQAIMIDPSQLMADVNGENNVYQAEE
jgi:aminopeptidase N